ncbi:MFS transporter [Streptomyces sp. NPDC059740]|uniref:MFS transporter n=1 Tax=Streptomyces sp. NPDC059740 TaxID=3346926 RepID=UPI00365643CC
MTTPAPSPAGGSETASAPVRTGAFAALRQRDYRRFFLGQLVSNTGTWTQLVAQDWLVLRLTGHTLDVGITSALQFLPVLVFSLVGGAAADRWPTRRLLVVSQVLLGLFAAVLAVLTLTGAVRLYLVFALALLTGSVRAFSAPALQGFVSEVTGPELLRNAVSLGALNFQSARLVGPSVAGLVISVVGIGWAFAVNALSYAVVVATLLAVRAGAGQATATRRKPGGVREGLAHVRQRPELLWPITLVACVCTFGYNFPTLLAGFANGPLHADAQHYSFMTASLGAGAVVGALVTARLGDRGKSRLVAYALAFAATEALAGAAPGYTVFLVLLVAMGLVSIIFNTTANATVQLAVEQGMRGRVMGLYSLAFSGGTTVGGPLVGWAVDAWGARAAMGICALVTLVGAAAVSVSRARATAVSGSPEDGGLPS